MRMAVLIAEMLEVTLLQGHHDNRHRLFICGNEESHASIDFLANACRIREQQARQKASSQLFRLFHTYTKIFNHCTVIIAQ